MGYRLIDYWWDSYWSTVKRPDSRSFSSDQPILNRSSGVSRRFFTSTLFSVMMQWKEPSIVHTRFTSPSFLMAHSIRARSVVRSSLTKVWWYASIARSAFLDFIMLVFVERRTNFTMIGRSFNALGLGKRWLTLCHAGVANKHVSSSLLLRQQK